MSEQQWTLGSKGHFEVFWVFMVALREGVRSEAQYSVCMSETKWQYEE